MDASSKPLRSGQTVLPWALTIALTVALAVSLGRFREIRAEAAKERFMYRSLQTGGFIPAFTAPSTAGVRVRLGGTGPDSLQVVVLLTSSCPYCLASLPAWQQLAQELSDSSRPVAMIGLTTDSAHIAKAYAAASGLKFVLVPIAERRLVSLLRASTVPQTVLVGPDGRILYSRLGTLERGPALDSLRAAISDQAARARVDL